MNNRYLFRGKRVDNGKWVYGGIYYQPEDEIKKEAFYIIGGSLNDVGHAYKIKQETVGQCTGRKYANDKLLFEGDVVEWYSDYDDVWGYSHTAEYCGVIAWNATEYCWSIKTNHELIPLNDCEWDIAMVIGNIHDNPELLEVKE